MSWVQTFAGSRFDHAHLSKNEYRKTVIVHSLAQINRYGGHAKHPYSVAQHTCHVVVEACRLFGRENPNASLAMARLVGAVAVLHDAPEAYVGDMTAPLKRADFMETYREHEDEIAWWIRNRFLPIHTSHQFDIAEAYVKRADLRMLAREAPVLLGPPVEPWQLPEPPAEFVSDAQILDEPWTVSRDRLSAVWDAYCVV